MHISSVAIENYKSFFERTSLNFDPGFNLLLGANNAGKSTVLEALDLELINEPHRSVQSIPTYGGAPFPHSIIDVGLVTNIGEMVGVIGNHGVFLPIPQDSNLTGDYFQHQIRALIDESAPIQMRVSLSRGVEAVNLSGGVVSGGGNSSTNQTLFSARVYRPDTPGSDSLTIEISHHGVSQAISQYHRQFRSRVYRFLADRRPGSLSGPSTYTVLDRAAANLPFVINHLQTKDAHGHKTLCGWINRVFPSVQWVQATSLPNGNFELSCLPTQPEARRDDLSVPIARMGTGIGNVIAMLYVVLTAREPQVIAIDEPNAFLHPRALRELLVILESEGKKHQYILSAHSADVLTSVKARTISLLEFDGASTKVTQVNEKQLHAIRGGLADLGIRMTELHAKDRVLWVEGQSEEEVFPSLLRWACPQVAAGVAVLRVERTGTFGKKGVDVSEIIGIYERLSNSSALVPPMVSILLDGESRSSEERRRLNERCEGKISFLDRRMLENYLIHAAAIAAMLSELSEIVETKAISDRLIARMGDVGINDIDGAKLLGSLVSDLTDARQEFRKTRDVPVLVDWLIENDPSHLAPLRSFLVSLFGIA